MDSCVLIPLSRGEVDRAFLLTLPRELHLNHVVVGEYLAGTRNPEHRRSKEAAAWFAGFRKDVTVLSGTETTAAQYARLHHHTRRVGRPVPTNDLWIAATAAGHRLTVLTCDQHFQDLPGVQVQLLEI